jgi:hypothetical protein
MGRPPLQPATIAVAITGPTPGIAVSRLAALVAPSLAL